MKWELKKLDRDAKKAGMRRLVKTFEATWWNGPGSRFAKADLDHVVAAEHLRFTPVSEILPFVILEFFASPQFHRNQSHTCPKALSRHPESSNLHGVAPDDVEGF